jgi:hypothetical protein
MVVTTITVIMIITAAIMVGVVGTKGVIEVDMIVVMIEAAVIAKQYLLRPVIF